MSWKCNFVRNHEGIRVTWLPLGFGCDSGHQTMEALSDPSAEVIINLPCTRLVDGNIHFVWQPLLTSGATLTDQLCSRLNHNHNTTRSSRACILVQSANQIPSALLFYRTKHVGFHYHTQSARFSSFTQIRSTGGYRIPVPTSQACRCWKSPD